MKRNIRRKEIRGPAGTGQCLYYEKITAFYCDYSINVNIIYMLQGNEY